MRVELQRRLNTEELMLMNHGAGEDLRMPWTARRSNQSNLKEISPWILTGRTDAEAETLILWPPNIKNWLEKTLMLGKIEDRRRRGQRGWNGWMATPTWWMWVWVRFRSWTGKPGVLQSVGLQRVSHDLATELNSTELSRKHQKHNKLLNNHWQRRLETTKKYILHSKT